MQNKPNFRKAKMDVNIYYTNGYENKSDWTLGENKPNQTQFKPKTNPIFKIPKMSVSDIITRNYKNLSCWRGRKNKPNQTQFKPNWSSVIRRPSSVFCHRSSVLPLLFPDETAFSFDLVPRPVILKANIRQLRRPMEREKFEQFKARKETYHVH